MQDPKGTWIHDSQCTFGATIGQTNGRTHYDHRLHHALMGYNLAYWTRKGEPTHSLRIPTKDPHSMTIQNNPTPLFLG